MVPWSVKVTQQLQKQFQTLNPNQQRDFLRLIRALERDGVVERASHHLPDPDGPTAEPSCL